MKSILSTILTVALATGTMHAESLPIIPKPLKESLLEGHFTLTANTAIRFPTHLRKEAELLAKGIQKATGLKLKTINARLRIHTPHPIQLTAVNNTRKPESYTMEVSPHGVTLSGSDAAGTFYASQTLLQLIPLEGDPNIPACEITDQPRFGWRGMHLDVGRHIFAPKDIKKFIDWLAFHKFNTFHWHLTEDQGWRIEIKKYPKLTSIGSFRASSPPYGNRNGSDGTRYGGFYTQKQIKNIVAYAQERHITIVPEIDMPGHMAAAITAYPKLGNDDIPNYKPQVYTRWGVHPYVLAPKEETFQWIDDILEELCELFPSPYIHIGGDEAPKEQWKKSKLAQEVMKREGCKNEHALQSYFIGRIEKMLEKRGRKLIGWDEIREGGLSPKATLMLWRGWTHAIASVNEGHDVVMAPGSHTYFDHYQHDPEAILSQGVEYEAIGGHRTIQSVYSFNPMPEQFRGTPKAKHILGCQGQLWTEYMKTWKKVEYRAFPRIAALAEVAWSNQDDREFKDFMTRLKPMMARYKKAGVNAFDVFNPPALKAPETKDGTKLTTSMKVHKGHMPEFAYDGKPKTFFWAGNALREDDHFTLTFKSPTRGTATFQTGGKASKKGDMLEHGVLETSTDGKTWTTIADFSEGKASGKFPNNTTHLRLRVTKPQTNWLIIHEIVIKSPSL